MASAPTGFSRYTRHGRAVWYYRTLDPRIVAYARYVASQRLWEVTLRDRVTHDLLDRQMIVKAHVLLAADTMYTTGGYGP